MTRNVLCTGPQISEDGEVAISGDSEGNVLVWALEEGLCAIRLQVRGRAHVRGSGITVVRSMNVAFTC